jgi:cation-transporting ATPase 13A1
VNYRGRPFMQDLRENHLFYRSLLACYAVLTICALEVFPPLNDLLQLSALPTTSTIHLVSEISPSMVVFLKSVDFSIFLCAIMALNTFLSFAFEKAILRSFENELLC